MDIDDQEFLDILSAFNENEVIFMLVGGFAVNYYGYSRTTADFDLWVNPTNGNKELIIKSLLQIGFTKEEMSDLQQEDFTQPFTFQIGGKTFYIDIMTFITGIIFEEAYNIAIDDIIAGKHKLKIIHRNHLIINKVLTGRTKDKADVEILQRIEQKKHK